MSFQKGAAFLVSIIFVSLLVLYFFPNVYGQGQVMQDISCPSCITILDEELELYKQLFPLIIWTDDVTYDHNSIITVNGYLRPDNTFNPITIMVTSPIGNLVTVEQVTPDETGDFMIKFNTQSPLWKQDGNYIIKAQSGSESRVFKTSIELIPLEKGTQAKCSINEITTPADNGGTYCIPFKALSGHTTGVEGFLNTVTKTLTLDIRGTNIDSVIVDIPRQILDSKSPDGNDSEFVVMFKGMPATFEEQEETKQNHRTLKITYPPDRKGKIEIVGTIAIPEFGSFVVFALLVAITSIVIIFKNTKFAKPLMNI